MKSFFYLFVISVILLSFHCNEESIYACEGIRSGLLNYDVELAKPGINDILDDLYPQSVTNDMIGHSDNLEQFIARIIEECGFNSTIECYACIETLPLQSEVTVYLDSASVLVSRTLDILTPADTVMTLRSIHR